MPYSPSLELLRRLKDPKRIGFIGACISRDVTRYMFPVAPFRDTFWRVGTMALVDSTPVPTEYKSSIKTEDMKFFVRNFDKSYDLSEFFLMNDVVFIDQFRDTYSTLILANGAKVTDEARLASYNLKNVLDIESVVASYPANFPEKWLHSARILADIINSSGSYIVICPIFAVSGIRNKTVYENTLHWNSFQARLVNTLDYYMTSILNVLIHKSFLMPRASHFAEADLDHEYGPANIHLNRQYYDAMITEFKIRLRSMSYDKIPTTDERKNLIEGYMAMWQADASVGYGFTKYPVALTDN